MNYLYLVIACLLLLLTTLLLRQSTPRGPLISIMLLFAASSCFIMVYGILGGIFITIASFLVTGLFTAFTLGKKKQ